MACGGCKQRQAIGGHMVSAFKRGDMSMVGVYGREMMESLGTDIKMGAVKVKDATMRSPVTPRGSRWR